MITYRLTYIARYRPRPRPHYQGYSSRHKTYYSCAWRSDNCLYEEPSNILEAKLRSGEYRYVPRKPIERPQESNLTPVKKKRLEEESESLLSTVSSRRFSEDEESCEASECPEKPRIPLEPMVLNP
jgi:hypothetical protein